MLDTIINVNTLPESLYRRFRSDRVRVREENGEVILAPFFSDDVVKVKPHLRFIGLLSQESFDEINEVLLDTQRVDVDEW